MLGYPKNLYILPLDHRDFLVKILFGLKGALNVKDHRLMEKYRELVFDGFYAAYKKLNNKPELAILVDEEFGSSVLNSARKKKIVFCLSTEKSGQSGFTLEYGRDFGKHIEKFHPPIVKALVRYNPANIQVNRTQLKRLKQLSDWCHTYGYKFLLEPLVPPTVADLEKCHGRQDLFDKNIRPRLAQTMVKETQLSGVEPDIWKIEAFESTKDWEKIIPVIRRGQSRSEVGIVLLGRNASFAQVKRWFNLAPREQLNGFAVGRTVFLRAVEEFHAKKINRPAAVKIIADNYAELVRYWTK